MAFVNIEKAVQQVVFDGKLKVLDEFVKLVQSKPDEDLDAVLAEFKESLTTNHKVMAGKSSKGKAKNDAKGKKEPTVYNRYISMRIKLDKLEFKDAVLSYKDDPMAIFLKSKVKELKNDDPDATGETIFDKAVVMWKEEQSDEETVEHKTIEPKKAVEETKKVKFAKKVKPEPKAEAEAEPEPVLEPVPEIVVEPTVESDSDADSSDSDAEMSGDEDE